MQDLLGDALKLWEVNEDLNAKVLPSDFAYMRLDGRSFSKLTKNMRRPFDDDMTGTMAATAWSLAHEFNADFAYVQSDEISLGWVPKANPNAEFVFNGNKQKLLSVIPAYATGQFIKWFESKAERMPPHDVAFDGRIVSSIPHKVFQQLFFWRFKDARRNGLNQFARAHFSHKELQGLKGYQILEKITNNDAVCNEWNNVPIANRLGAFLYRRCFVQHDEFVSAFDQYRPDDQSFDIEDL